MKLTKYGRKEWLSGTILAAVLLSLCAVLAIWLDKVTGISLGCLVAVIWVGFVGFFRDPNRKVPMDKEEVLLSPADGVVRDCELIPNGSCGNEELSKLFEGQDMLRIGIFLSVFDVHLNRAPCKMTVEFTAHKNGAYHDARNTKAIKENESQITGGVGQIGEKKFPVAVKQISGAIARRIVCPVEKGLVLEKGERYGMIKFGSRTELYLPVKSGFEPAVSIGDRVHGGLTPIAVYNGNKQ